MVVFATSGVAQVNEGEGDEEADEVEGGYDEGYRVSDELAMMLACLEFF